MKKGNRISFREQFKEALRYIAETKYYILAVVVLFLFCTITGYVQADKLAFINEYLQEILVEAEGLPFPDMTIFILQNNTQTALYAMLLGLFLGIFPIITTITNGIVIGYVINIASTKAGMSILETVWRLVPHGIFEIPAIFISLAIGIKLGMFFITKNQSSGEELKYRLYNAINTFLFVIIPLLIMAAIIEALLITLAPAG